VTLKTATAIAIQSILISTLSRRFFSESKGREPYGRKKQPKNYKPQYSIKDSEIAEVDISERVASGESNRKNDRRQTHRDPSDQNPSIPV
jgi:hypothetical protein